MIDLFLKYVSYPTMSDEESEKCPSSDKQLILGREIVSDLIEAGLDAFIDEHGYVYGDLPATADCPANVPTVGLIAHMDTSDAASDTDIKTRTVLYDGNPVILGKDADGNDIILSEDAYPCLKYYAGKHLIVTDGTTLLGADDKAGVTEIIAAVKEIKASGVTHGRIRVGITPDEEIGRGANLFDVEGFGADLAYTVDGGRLGQIEYENFNAASAEVTFRGISIHPGDAKDRMKNAASIACEYQKALPGDMVPEKTEGYEGFIHLIDMEGSCEYARLRYIIRDHDRGLLEEKKALMAGLAEEFNGRYGEETVNCILRDSYYNMREIIEQNMYIVDHAKAAMKANGVEPEIIPIRGGTDGAVLSFKGLPCPNLCTGGENFHSRFEFACVEDMEKIKDIIKETVISYARS